MSMIYYSFDDYGIILKKDEVIEFCRKYLKENDEDWYNELFSEGREEIDACECQERVDSCIQYIRYITGEAQIIGKDGSVSDCDEFDLSCDTFFYIPILKYPNLFERAFESFDEMVQKHKKVYGKYLPDDFDWDRRFAHIVGTCYG